MTSDSNDIEILQRQMAELQAKLDAAREVGAGRDDTASTDGKTIDTQGGAFVEKDVEVINGHFIGRDFVQIVTRSSEDPEEAKSVIALYLHALSLDLSGLKLGEVDASTEQARQSPLQLADIFVPLDTTLSIPGDMTLTQWHQAQKSHSQETVDAQRETRPVSALEGLAEHRELTLLGKPGSGKSTFGASVLLALAQVWQGDVDKLGDLGPAWTHGPKLPIRVVLRHFAEKLPPGDAPARAGDLWDFIAEELKASGYGFSTGAMKYIERIARNHGALILFDGLDECGDETRRERVLAALREFITTTGDNCRYLLTARPYARPGGQDTEKGVYVLADLNDGQIKHFIEAWYAALVVRNWRSPGEAERSRDDLLQARQRADLQPLAENPLLLTLMTTLHTNRGRLPDDRADLYDESVELLMLRWNQRAGADKALLVALEVPGLKLSDLREALEEMAFNIHEQNIGQQGTADIGEDRLNRSFRPLLNDSKDKADLVTGYIEKRAGLLLGQGEKQGERQFTFPHRTFQEFLAACHLAARDDFPAECVRLARQAPTHWQVVLPLAARLAKAERGASAADELIGGCSIGEFQENQQPKSDDWICALLAGMQLLEIGLGSINKNARMRAITERVAGWLFACLPVHPSEGGPPAAQRAQAGDILAALGDPRFDPQRHNLPGDELLGMVYIPTDPDFKIGTRVVDRQRMEKFGGFKNDEINDTASPSPVFYIARYPVTVGQFKDFVEASGTQISDNNALGDPVSRPVCRVSWHEALAYCNWLNDELSTSQAFAHSELAVLVRDNGWRFTLPSEFEWERAARGDRVGAAFPWGEEPDPDQANTRETEIGTTSVVGCFPANDFGLYDMSGNIFEWTRSLWGKDFFKPDFTYPYDPEDSGREDLDARDEILRVVRGGSWGSQQAYARCTARDGGQPDLRGDDLGFRLVLRSAPDS